MKINANQNDDNAWLRLELEGEQYDDFEIRAINRGIDGLLRMDRPISKEERVVDFNIQGYLPLLKYLDHYQFESSDLLEIIKMIIRRFYCLCNHLLCGQNILLEPQFVFLDRTFVPHFAYLPEGNLTLKDMDESLNHLVAFLYRRLSHKDQMLMSPGDLIAKIASEYHASKKACALKPEQAISDNLHLSSRISQSSQGNMQAVKKEVPVRKKQSGIIFRQYAVAGLGLELLFGLILYGGAQLLKKLTGDYRDAMWALCICVLGLNILGVYFLLTKQEGAHTKADSVNGMRKTVKHKALKVESQMTERLVREKQIEYLFYDQEECVFCFSTAHQEALIGRNKEVCTWHIASSLVGRTHAKLYTSGSGVQIMDLNSLNGTFVNGVSIRDLGAVDLKSGDNIIFGTQAFNVSVNERVV